MSPSNLPPGVSNADIEATNGEPEPGTEIAKDLIEQPPAGGGPLETQVAIVLKTNEVGMTVELQFPEGVVPHETNLAHVVAWYVANGMNQLLPVAVNSWHRQRVAMLNGGQPKPEENTAIAGAEGVKLLGADGVPLGS